MHLSSLTLTWRRRHPLLMEMPLQPAQVSLAHSVLSNNNNNNNNNTNNNHNNNINCKSNCNSNNNNDDNNLQAFQQIIARHLLGAFHCCDTTAKDCSELMYAITAVCCTCSRPFLCLPLLLAGYCWYRCRQAYSRVRKLPASLVAK